MADDCSVNRRVFLENLATASAGGLAALAVGPEIAFAADDSVSAGGARLNMVGSYGPWLAETVLGEKPAATVRIG